MTTQAKRRVSRPAKKAPSARPVLQWVAAGLGLAITLSAVIVLVRDALEPARPAQLSVKVLRSLPAPSGWAVEIDVHNSGGDAAAAVTVEGVAAEQTATVSMDYVPGDGHSTAFLAFAGTKPAALPAVRITGWSEP